MGGCDDGGGEAEAEEAPGVPTEEAATDSAGSDLRLMYNSVCSYVSAIIELWKHQVAEKLHASPSPHNLAVKALETSVSINAAAMSLRTEDSPQSRMGTLQSRYPT